MKSCSCNPWTKHCRACRSSAPANCTERWQALAPPHTLLHRYGTPSETEPPARTPKAARTEDNPPRGLPSAAVSVSTGFP